MPVRFGVPSSLRTLSIDRASPCLESRTFTSVFSTANPNMIRSKYTMGISEDSQLLYDIA